MATTLGRVVSGLMKKLDLTGVPDGTDLHGFQSWICYYQFGSPLGIYQIVGGEIESHANLVYAMALWGDAAVGGPGQCVRAEVMSMNWNAAVPGLCANGKLLHEGEIRCDIGNGYELMSRAGTDYGAGFPIASGGNPQAPLVNGHYYDLLLGAVQQPAPGVWPRGGVAFNSSSLAFNDTNTGLSSGFNDGITTFPGLLYYASPGMRWRNYRVYRDYRITLQGLIGSQAFRFFNAVDVPLFDSASHVGGYAHINVHTVPWPFTGYIQVYTDPTWSTPVSGGRYPDTGSASDFVGGDWFGQISTGARTGVLINWEDDVDFPDEWSLHADKDVTADLVECHIIQVAANPRIEVDTCILTLRDPTGKYVPARTQSPLYPNVKLQREGRVVFERNGVTACRFYGRIREYQPVLPHKNDADRQQKCEIRLESPLRDLADAQVTLITAPVGILVNPDGTGVIADILALIPDIIPAASWQLEPTDVSITDAAIPSGTSIQSALETLAILADAVYFIKPHERRATDQPNFYFVWRPRQTDRSVVDHTWVDTGQDISFLTPRFTSDDI